MNWKEFALNMTPYRTYKAIKNINENGFVDGSKKTLKDIYVENMPIIGNIYDYAKDEGKHEGMKDGYSRASSVYEKKLLKQADEFFNQRDRLAENIKERDELLNEYEKYICEMEAKFNSLTSDQRMLLDEMKVIKEKLSEYTSL